MQTSDVVALLDLLAARGTVAWHVAGSSAAGARLVIDTSGVDSAAGLLIARGFIAVAQQLPARLELAHPRFGRVVLLPCRFDGSGGAVWPGPDGDVTIPAHAFDPLDAVPRGVSVDPEASPA